jgi:hypothetical protein
MFNIATFPKLRIPIMQQALAAHKHIPDHDYRTIGF